jgi:hypothetical protein
MNWRVPGTHGACNSKENVVKAKDEIPLFIHLAQIEILHKNPGQVRATAAESRIFCGHDRSLKSSREVHTVWQVLNDLTAFLVCFVSLFLSCT